MIEVVRAPAYATVQDAGREGFRSSGVPRGGAMDLLSLFAGNLLLGNAPGAAAIECALTGGSVRFRDDAGIILTGARADARLGGSPAPHGRVLQARAGDVLTVDSITAGRFLYLCIRGGLEVPVVLGGRGTYLPAAFGGFEGRRLASGDVLRPGPIISAEPTAREVPHELRTIEMSDPLGLVRGPQADALPQKQWHALIAEGIVVSPHSDRTGYRLAGLAAAHVSTVSGRSEPSCSGAVQLTPAGELIVLMADGPTVGGYPKIGIVAAAHLPRLAQAAVGERLRFRIIDPTEAVSLLAAQRSGLRSLVA
ncbi:biotin-dependent carboxyltransferase family protein [soil metagenome]